MGLMVFQVLAKLVDDENLDLQVCGKMILAIENIFKLVSALLHQVSPEESHLYNACFSLYGLESSTDGGLVVYPACRPRCLSMIPGLELPSKKVCNAPGFRVLFLAWFCGLHAEIGCMILDCNIFCT